MMPLVVLVVLLLLLLLLSLDAGGDPDRIRAALDVWNIQAMMKELKQAKKTYMERRGCVPICYAGACS
jgi:hypothetical protein